MVEVAQIETDLLAFVRREVFAPQVDATLDTDLVAAGFDSMSLVRLLVFVETTYGMWVPESEITGESLQNLRTLASTVARLLNAR
jgi:acyl carrier protein